MGYETYTYNRYGLYFPACGSMVHFHIIVRPNSVYMTIICVIYTRYALYFFSLRRLWIIYFPPAAVMGYDIHRCIMGVGGPR